MLEIKSNKNSTIKYIKSLSKKKNRWENKSFIIEGIKIIQEAIMEKKDIKNIICNDSFLSAGGNESFLKEIKDHYNIIKVEDNIFKEISYTESPQGILAVVGFDINDLDTIDTLRNPVLLFLDGVQDPGNLGTIIRSADAFEIDGIILGKGTVDPYNTKVVRSTMGSIFRTAMYFCEDSLECIKHLQKDNFQIISTSPQGETVSKYQNTGGTIFIIGNESKGVEPEIIHICDRNIKIPMPGKAESLNVGVAASIIMYENMKSKSL